MRSSQRQRRARRNHQTVVILKRRALFALETREWDRMPAVGREFGSPDFDRLMEEDFHRRQGVFDPTLSILGTRRSLGMPKAALPVIEARMRAQATELVMGGTRWLTAADMPNHAIPLLALWLEQGRLFALEQEGVQLFPDYAFDSIGEPVPVLQDVLNILAGRSPFQIASWFESPSAYLNAKRPREVLELDGAAVVMAAYRLVEGAVHG